MITIGPLFSGFKKFFKDLLTVYQLENDSYKDINNEGLFQRYMALFGESIDVEQANQIENYLNIIDASLCDEKFLIHLSDDLGNPPDVFLNVEQYRNLLLYITNVYKVKGTSRGYLLFFYILGFIVITEDVIPETELLNYDSGHLYDDGSIYDPETCQFCTLYNLRIKKIEDEDYQLDSSTLVKMNDAIKFNEPINARLGKFTIVIEVVDEVDITLTDDPIDYTIDYHFIYDSPLLYDLTDPVVPDYDNDIIP